MGAVSPTVRGVGCAVAWLVGAIGADTIPNWRWLTGIVDLIAIGIFED
jgi:hypothetical protein